MHSEQHFSLCWNDHHSTLVAIFESLLESGTLVDCTIAAEGQFLKAHKVVLSACSPYFQLLLSQQNENHPIIILKDVKFQELKAMIDYIYRGEVKISEERLGDFLEAAESLQIKGLGDGNIRDGLEKAGLTEPPMSTRRSAGAGGRWRRHFAHGQAHGAAGQASYQAYMGALPPHPSTPLPAHPGAPSAAASVDDGPQELPPIPDVTLGGCDLPPPCQPSPSSLSGTSSPAVSTPAYGRSGLVASDDGSDGGLGALTPTSLKREAQAALSAHQMILEPKIEYLEKNMGDGCVDNLTMLYDMDEMAELKAGPQAGERECSDTKANMRLHARQLRYACPECGKAFPRASQLKIHARTHTGERPYSCDTCAAAFKKSGDLKIHKRLHTGERPYQCALCERAFISNSDLHKHKRVHGVAPSPSTRSSSAAAAAAAAAGAAAAGVLSPAAAAGLLSPAAAAAACHAAAAGASANAHAAATAAGEAPPPTLS